ncbi:MAG TPA: hypothetical protein VHO48_03720, partial [Anaerolineaceae bacterium]|nr:hypothetical protein [Anaerolineaceae bacterium]
KLQAVYQMAFAGGALDQTITAFSETVRAANTGRSLVDANAYDQAVASAQSFVARRGEYLATTALLGGQN